MVEKKKQRKMDRATAALVKKIVAARSPIVQQETDDLLEILRKRSGRKGAISSTDLAAVLWGPLDRQRLGEVEWHEQNAERNRQIRRRVKSLREACYPICIELTHARGYYFAKDNADIRESSRYFDLRAETSHRMASKIMGQPLLEYQADRIAESIENERDAEQRKATMARLVDRLMANPLTREAFLAIVGVTMTADEKALVMGTEKQLAVERGRIKWVHDQLVELAKATA